jgi:hypothetical protein
MGCSAHAEDVPTFEQIDSEDVLSEMAIPVLITHGNQDTVALLSMARALGTGAFGKKRGRGS